jgi:hypothetical protein
VITDNGPGRQTEGNCDTGLLTDARIWFVDVFATRGYRRGALSPTRYPEAPS